LKKCTAILGILFLTAGLIGCSNSMTTTSLFDDTAASQAESDHPGLISDDIADTMPTLPGDPGYDSSADHVQSDHLVYDTETRTFDSIRAMKAELEQSSQADTVSFYELQGLPDAYAESGVEWAEQTDYYIYYVSADEVIAFMPFESESAASAMKDDWLSNHGTYENLLANDLIHDVVKTDIPTNSGIAYECTYNTRLKTGLKLRYYEYQDSATGRNYILSVDLSPDGSIDNSVLFVFDDKNSFMCGGNTSDLSIEAAFGLFSVTV